MTPQEAVAFEPAPIPFNRPSIVGKEYEYIRQAIDQGHISGDGSFTKACERCLESIHSAARVLLTTSCTDALEMSALLLNVEPGSEVVVPAFTFVSTANAFVLRGARPVFCDVRPDTFNLDETALPELITAKTRVIVPVHYAGVGCEMTSIMNLAAKEGLDVVEDNAQGLLGHYHGRSLGTFGKLSTLSFHETKNVSCGEGGALVINDGSLVERAEILREKGTNRSRFFRGQVDKYTWVDIGSSFLPSDLLAAFLYAQLEARERIQSARCLRWKQYADGLRDWATRCGVRLPLVPTECDQPFHMFYLLLPTPEARDRLIAHLRSQRITSVFHYIPLNVSEMGMRHGGRAGQCPVAEDISRRLVRLPFYTSLTTTDLCRVIDAVLAFEL
ncbi:MAG TPA: dTDP-4-amino-4,6-dideoxygalactose transaminase [Bryobacteraceae bacterium]|nr:dTDP-4-amino-4,6-dideoxygalactose transaminase [Bryobacteraceae bacterium]